MDNAKLKNLKISPKLHNKLRMHCVKKQIKIYEFVEEVLTKELEKKVKK